MNADKAAKAYFTELKQTLTIEPVLLEEIPFEDPPTEPVDINLPPCFGILLYVTDKEKSYSGQSLKPVGMKFIIEPK